MLSKLQNKNSNLISGSNLISDCSRRDTQVKNSISLFQIIILSSRILNHSQEKKSEQKYSKPIKENFIKKSKFKINWKLCFL